MSKESISCVPDSDEEEGNSTNNLPHTDNSANSEDILTTPEEVKLYKKLRNLQLKVRRCKNREKKHDKTLEVAQSLLSNKSCMELVDNSTSTGKILKLLQNRSQKRRKFNFNEQFTSLSIYKQNEKGYQFLSNSTNNLPHTDNSANSEDILTTPEEVKLYKKLRNLQLKVRRCKNREKKHDKTLEVAQSLLSNKSCMELVDNSTSTGKILKLLQNRSQKRRKFNFNEQFTSLSIYKQNEKGYQFLSNSTNNLPHTDNSANSEDILTTPEEVKLYKKLRNLQLKVRRCKNREKKHDKTLEVAQSLLSNKSCMELVDNSTSTGKILKLLQNRSQKRRKFNFNEQFTSLSIYKQNEKGYQFLSNSTNNLPHTDNSANSEDILTTPEEVKLYKKLRNLQLKVRRCKNREKKHDKTLEVAQSLLSNKSCMELVDNSTSTGKILKLLQNRSQKRRKFNFNEQFTSLSIYKQNEKAYQFLSKIFKLPKSKTLGNFIQKIVFMPGINKDLLKKLKKKAKTMFAKSRLCVLLFDELALQSQIEYSVVGDKIHLHEEVEGGSLKYATHVVVFMLKGLFENYIQPIAYTFSFGMPKAVELKQFIHNIIKEVRQSGFVVVATVCKQGTNNQDAIQSLIEDTRMDKLKSGEEHTLNTFYVGELEIIPLYDPPNLLKDLRNNLLEMPLLHENEEGKVCTFKWEQIQKLYTVNLETSGDYNLLYMLTEEHVVPEKINKSKVVFASQIFSQKFAAVMNFFSRPGFLPPEYKDTALLILLINQLFDTMNGSPKKDFECFPLLGAVKCSPRCPHRKKWKEAKQVFSKMEILNKNNIHGPTIKKYLWNIEGFQYISKKLAFKYGISSIWTGRLNQDPLEKFLHPSHWSERWI